MFACINAKNVEMDDETCCVITSSIDNLPNCQPQAVAANSSKEKQDVWSYNSIYGEDAESLTLDSSFMENLATLGNVPKQQSNSKSLLNDEYKVTAHSSPGLDASFDNQTLEENDSINFLEASNPLPRDTENDQDNCETQLIVDPSSLTNPVRNSSRIGETQDISVDEIIADTYWEDHDSVDFLPSSKLSKRRIEESCIDETQLDETCVLEKQGPSPPKKPRNVEAMQEQKGLLQLSKQTPCSQEESSSNSRTIVTQLSTETKSEKHVDCATLDDTNFEYDAMFESQSKRESSVMSTPESDDDLSFLRGRSPSPVVARQCPSPVFLVPSEDYFIRRRKTPSSSQKRTLSQQSQDIRPLSLNTQEFEHDLKTALTSTQCEALTQMTQDMEPLSLQLPSTPEFERQLNNRGGRVAQENYQDLGSMTQMTQEMEPLSLQLPSTPEFQRQLNVRDRGVSQYHALESMTQMTQEMEPLSLMLPDTQEFHHQLLKSGNHSPIIAGNAVAEEKHPISLPLGSSESYKNENSNNNCLQSCTEDIQSTPEWEPSTPEFHRQLATVTDNVQYQSLAQTSKSVDELVSDKPLSETNSSEETKENLQPQENTPESVVDKNTPTGKRERRKKPTQITAKDCDLKKPVLKKTLHVKCVNDTTGELEANVPSVAFSNNSSGFKKIVKELGGAITDIEKASVFVCDKYRMTWKMKIALDKKIPVVSSNWLDESKKSRTFQPTVPYILLDNRKTKM